MKVIFLESKEDFTPSEKRDIEKTLLMHGKRAARALGYRPKHFTFTVYAGLKRTDRGGMPAFTQSPEWVWIAINPKVYRGEHAQMLERLEYLAYHEMHHAARKYTGFLPGKEEHTLMNCFISEGLADHFALEQHPSRYITERITYDVVEVKKWLKKFKKDPWTADYKKSEVMGGHGKPGSIGYKIGRFIMDAIKKRDPKFTATMAVKVDSRKLLKKSGV